MTGRHRFCAGRRSGCRLASPEKDAASPTAFVTGRLLDGEVAQRDRRGAQNDRWQQMSASTTTNVIDRCREGYRAELLAGRRK